MKQGDLIDGRFQLEAIAGQGGMGEVWRAFDNQTKQRVALKVLLARRKQEQARVLREANVLASLDHPGIVKYIAHGSTPSEEPYLVMEWLEGEDLAERLERTSLTVPESILVMKKISKALSLAHQKGIIHRDIKPANIWLVKGDLNEVKLLDFGLAQVDDGLGKLTRIGVFIGTPAYTSPEQAHALQSVDARSDIFSLGCVFFECLAGRTPFYGDGSLAILTKILMEDAPPLQSICPEAPDDLAALVAKMLEKDPVNRPQDVSQIALQLASLQPSGEVVSLQSITEQERQFICVLLAKDAFSQRPRRNPDRTTVQSSDELEPPSQRSQEARFLLRDMQRLVEEHGGKLFPVAGGALAVLFRGGVATDQAQKAGRCALSLYQRAPGAQMALTIHRGAARSPVGEVIERAAALLEDAPSKKYGILLDAQSAGLFEVRFDVVSEANRLFLRAERPLSLPKKTLLGRPTPYTGREVELSCLLEVAQDAFTNAHARIVCVTAEAGMGKSRLLVEFLERITQKETVPLILLAQADTVRAGAPFALLSSAIRRYAGILDGEPLIEQQCKLREMVSRNVSQIVAAKSSFVRLSGGQSIRSNVATYPAQIRVTEFLGEICGVHFAPEKSPPLRAARQNAHVMGEQMRRALEDWLFAESQSRPVLLVLEDLHAGDVPSVGFLDTALYRLKQSPFFLLSFARPEVRETFPVLWSSHEVEELPLYGIATASCLELIKRVLGDKIDDATALRLATRAKGNPFYVEELCRAIARGNAGDIPETILAMSQARFERLSPEYRRVLRAASIFGESFWSSGVSRLLGYNSQQEVEEWLPVLVEEELIIQEPQSKFPGEIEYSFQHALWRESSYASLTQEDLALGHGLAGEWLLEKRESDAWTLAEHFAKSAEASRSISWYLRSAEQSLEGNDFKAAASRAQKAIDCGAQDETLGTLWLLEGEVFLWQGNYQDAADKFSAAMGLLERSGLHWYKSAAGLVMSSFYLGRYDVLLSLIETLREEEPKPDVSALYATATSVIVIFSCIVGVSSIATEFLARLEDLIRRSTSLDPLLHAWASFSACYVAHFIDGDPNAFWKTSDEAVTGFAQLGDIRAMSSALTELGRAQAQLGEFEDAEHSLRLALAQAHRFGVLSVSPIARHFLASTLVDQGKLEEAKTLRLEAQKEFRAQNSKQMEGLVLVERAFLLLRAKQADEAQKLAEEGLSFLDLVPPFRSRSLARLAEIYLTQNKAKEALTLAREAKEILDSLGGKGYGETFIALIYAEALLANQAPEAKAAINLAQTRLLARAAMIIDRERREIFLRLVPENARLLRL